MKQISILMLMIALIATSLPAQDTTKKVSAEEVQTLVQKKVSEGKEPVAVRGGVAFLNGDTMNVHTKDGREISFAYKGTIDRLIYTRGLAIAEEAYRELPPDRKNLRVFLGKNGEEIYTKMEEGQPYAALNENIIFTVAPTYAEWSGSFKIVDIENQETVWPEFAEGKQFHATAIDENRILVLMLTSESVMTEKFGRMRRSTGTKIYEYNVNTNRVSLIHTLEKKVSDSPSIESVHFVKKENGTIGFFLLDIEANTTNYPELYNYYEYVIDHQNVQKIDEFEGVIFGVFINNNNTYTVFKDSKEKRPYLRNCNNKKDYRIDASSDLLSNIDNARSVPSKNGKLLVPIGKSLNKRDDRSSYVLEIDKEKGEVTIHKQAILFNSKKINY